MQLNNESNGLVTTVFFPKGTELDKVEEWAVARGHKLDFIRLIWAKEPDAFTIRIQRGKFHLYRHLDR